MVNIILPECSRVAGRRIDTCTTIIDLDGVSAIKLFTGKLKKFLDISMKITQDNYPELMHRLYISQFRNIFLRCMGGCKTNVG
jgi:hypothetical protein